MPDNDRFEDKVNTAEGIPMPIVTLNRWILLIGVALAILSGQAFITTLLFLMLLAAVVGGPEWSLVAIIGKKLFADKIKGAEREDYKLMRFNNTIALALLGLAQICFLAGINWLGWLFSIMIALAAGVALAGFCVGCFLFFRFRMLRYRLFNK